MESRAGLSPDEGTLGLRRRAHRRALRLRIARRFRPMVSLLRQRKLGIQRRGRHASPLRLHQRSAHQGVRAPVSLASRRSPGGPSGAQRFGSVNPRDAKRSVKIISWRKYPAPSRRSPRSLRGISPPAPAASVLTTLPPDLCARSPASSLSAPSGGAEYRSPRGLQPEQRHTEVGATEFSPV